MVPKACSSNAVAESVPPGATTAGTGMVDSSSAGATGSYVTTVGAPGSAGVWMLKSAAPPPSGSFTLILPTAVPSSSRVSMPSP